MSETMSKIIDSIKSKWYRGEQLTGIEVALLISRIELLEEKTENSIDLKKDPEFEKLLRNLREAERTMK